MQRHSFSWGRNNIDSDQNRALRKFAPKTIRYLGYAARCGANSQPIAGIGCPDLNGRASRRAQLSMRHGRRNYDRNIAGMGRAPRYFAFDLECISDRLFGVSKIEALEAVESSTAVPHGLSR